MAMRPVVLSIAAVAALLALVLAALVSRPGRDLLQDYLLFSKDKEICLKGLALRRSTIWQVESIDGIDGLRAIVHGLTPIPGQESSAGTSMIAQLKHRTTGARLVISMSLVEGTWERAKAGCLANSSCSQVRSPFLEGDSPALKIHAGPSEWFQHEYQGLLVSVHHTNHSEQGSATDLPRFAVCRPRIAGPTARRIQDERSAPNAPTPEGSGRQV
jgi:hypothetical protein